MKTSMKILFVAAAGLAVPAIVGAADAAENWSKQCAKCHGEDGKGQTTMGKKMGLKDYSDAAIQAAMTDEEIIKITKEGVKEKGKTMPGYAGKLSDEEITALVAHIRAFAGS